MTPRTQTLIPRGFKRKEDKGFWMTVASGLLVVVLSNLGQAFFQSEAWTNREAQWQAFANHCFGTRAAK